MNVLVISQNEICYNPRLAKAGDFLHSKGCKITVLNPVVGVSSKEIYESFVSERDWTFIENRLDKKSLKSYVKWIINSLCHVFFAFFWKYFRIKIGFNYVLSKNVLFTSTLIQKKSYDIVITNLLELLPFTVYIKKKYNIPYLIFDSQEYFKGQYSKYEKYKYDWIIEAENEYVHHANLTLATTYAMLHKLKLEYKKSNNILRVRNLPPKNLWIRSKNVNSDSTLKLIWHGMSINYGNCRGVHLLVEAIAKCKTDVHLYLQGKLSTVDYIAFSKRIKKLNIEDKVTFLPPAKPEEIIKSIYKYDIGLAGEIPEEENQLLTSSNKLFDYIAAGLATIVPNLPGLKETVEYYNTGLLYEPTNLIQLSSLIDQLNLDRCTLKQYKLNSLNALSQGLYWESDYEVVWRSIIEREKFINNIPTLATI